MKKPFRFRTFVYSQLLFTIVTVMLCTSVSSALSYNFIQERLTASLREKNEQLIASSVTRVSTLLAQSAEQIYLKVLADSGRVDYLGYYTDQSLARNVSDTTLVRDYLKGLLNSNPTLHSVAVFFPANHLLVNNTYIRYDLFYPERFLELSGYFALFDQISASVDRGVFVSSVLDEGKILRMARPIVAGRRITGIVILDYDVARTQHPRASRMSRMACGTPTR